MRRRTKKRRK